MEAENNLKANMQGDGQNQPTPNTPLLQEQGQYPQYGPSTIPAPPYYAPPSGAGYGVPPSQQPHHQVIAVPANQLPVVYAQPVESFVGSIVFSCFVFWCCNSIFGIIAFMLASEYSLSVYH